ncbi:MAG TPA: thiamine phosphate synthase [Patescibacteria group bacterium]|nr:thiamine phosphate synthase [Patescibacteria group bacterium]
MLRLPCVYPITDRAVAAGRSHADLVELLCRGGARLIQMRDKSAPPDRRLLAESRAAVAAARRHGARLILNDRADVAALCGAHGVHLGDEDLPASAARALLGADALIGVSTHSVDEAISAAREPVDYVALGPVFTTGHASVSRLPLGVDAVARAAASIDLPLVAIGGIDLSRAREVLDAGAASVAVIGDIMSALDIPARVAAYLSLRS